MKKSGSPSAMVKEKNSVFISFHVEYVHINFKGEWEVGQEILSTIELYLCVEPISAGIQSSANKPSRLPWQLPDILLQIKYETGMDLLSHLKDFLKFNFKCSC